MGHKPPYTRAMHPLTSSIGPFSTLYRPCNRIGSLSPFEPLGYLDLPFPVTGASPRCKFPSRDRPSYDPLMVAVLCRMDRTVSLPVQEFIRACERIIQFASNHGGLTEDDCHAAIFHATELVGDLEARCVAEVHQHDDGQKRAA